METKGNSNKTESAELSIIQKYVLLRSHPRKIFIDAVGLTWGVYYLYINDWVRAVAFMVGLSLFSLLTVWNVNPYRMAKTQLGRMGILHLHPVNFIVQFLSLVPTVYGIWNHNLEFFLIGLSGILLGHSYGWGRVNENFASGSSTEIPASDLEKKRAAA